MSDLAETLGVSVTPQPFETAIFGAPVWRLDVVDGSAGLARAALRAVVDDARRQDVALVSCRVPADSASDAPLTGAGFRHVERLLTFERPLDDGPTVPADLATPEEADAVAEIGASTFSHDRYHADPALSDAAADEIKRQWVRNGVAGRADAPIVARVDGAIAGFNLCMRRGDMAVIDLIGVAAAYRRRGIGRRLVRAALGHYAGVCARMRVGTQAANAPSIALYRGEGFAQVEAADTYHWTP